MCPSKNMSSSLLRIAAAVMLLVVFATTVVSAASHNLYPRCDTDVLSAQANGGQTVTLTTLEIHPSELIVACLAYDVVPLGAASQRACAVSHQTDYHFRLYLQATYQDPNTNGVQTVEYDVKEVSGGSANRIHVRLPAAGTFKLMFTNLAASESCDLQASVMLTAEAGSSDAMSSPPPALVGVTPNVLFTDSRSYTYFVFRHVRSSLSASADRAYLIEATRQCSDADVASAALRLLYVGSDDAAFQRETSTFSDATTLSLRKYFFDRTGSFRMCYQLAGGTSDWSESALISVYGGNPSYYTFENGQGPQGQIYIGRKVTVRFHGYGLDTRPNGDKAKFVEDGKTCDADAAGGVDVATDLGPADDWGPGTKFTEWTWTLRSVGSYKVCYKRRDAPWSEVPSLDEIGPGAIEHTAPPQAPIPTPTDGISHEDCPMAPNGDQQMTPYGSTLLKVTLTTSTVPSGYLTSLTRLLCVPEAAVTVVRQTRNSDGNLNLWLNFQCGGSSAVAGAEEGAAKKSKNGACNNQERKNYAVFLFESGSPLLNNLLWSNATQTSQDDIFAQDDTSLLSTVRHSRSALLIACATLIIVTIVVVYGVLKYKENRHYFIQFGVDEDDVDADGGEDELEIDEHGVIAKKKSEHHVPDATIELEVEP